MAYFGIICKLKDVHKDEKSENLYLAKACGEGVIVGANVNETELVLYLPSDGQIDHWFGDKFTLFRYNEDGSQQGGYLEKSGQVRAIRLRGNQSSGIVISLECVYAEFGDQGWNEGDHVSTINEKEFCRKYIPARKTSNPISNNKKEYKGKKVEKILYPEFEMHKDTSQLMYCLDTFSPGDVINLSLKMHGTSQRSMRTYAVIPNNWIRKLFHLKKKTKPVYICGTRRTVMTDEAGFYGTNEFRKKHHEKLAAYIEEGMEVFYEVVGYYGESEGSTIMPSVDNSKLNDKKFVKKYGKTTTYSYGCEPGESQMYVYRITADNGAREYTPTEIAAWCRWAGAPHVPYIETFTFTTIDDLLERINHYFEDLTDPIGKTHIKEGVVVRRLNYSRWEAWKQKTYEFKVLEGIQKASSDAPDMEEEQEV